MGSQFSGRREDLRLITGGGVFTDDHKLPNLTYAAFVRSDHAHAKLLSVDVEAAISEPGVLAVLTSSDMVDAGYWRWKPQLPFAGTDGTLKSPELPALASDRVRYVGESIAVVIAENAHLAQEAAESILVEYETLAPVLDVDSALSDGSLQLYDDVPGNLSLTYQYGDAERTRDAFENAAYLARLTLDSDRVIGNPLEPKAAIASWNGDILHLWSPSQGITGLRSELATATGIPAENIQLHSDDVGGAFGIRGAIYPEYIALALAARRVGRPVKWLASRSETFVSDFQGRAIRMTGELALDQNGKFLAIRHDWRCDMGAWPSGHGPVTVILNPTLMTGGAYDIPAISGIKRLVLTNKVPTSAYRGAGRPEMAYIVERLVDEAARLCGIDRIELRRRNMIPMASFPYKVTTAPFPCSYDIADFKTLIDRALAAAKWNNFEGRRKEAKSRGMLRGIGFALFIEPSGGVVPSDEAAITFDRDGDVILHTVAASSGQGHETVMPEIVARIFETEPDRIRLHASRPDGPALKGAAAFASRTAMSHGSVLATAAKSVLIKAHVLAATELEVDADEIGYAAGIFRASNSNRSISLFEIAQRHPGELDTISELPSPRAFPSGAHVAEVEIDPETGDIEIINYVSVDDCGVVLNHTLVEGQIQGGLVQGLGQVFGERCVYDEQGQIISGSFMDYPMPRADMLSHSIIEALEVPSPSNQLGVKGVGEAGTVGALPTAMNAILDALSAIGVTHFDMPASPYRIW